MISKARFGRTGHMSSRTIFGAFALASASQDEADRVLELLLRHGVNHIDTAASYGDSELRIGPWMARHRKDFFLATKTGERTYQKAWDEFRRSLDRLQVDSVDLIQLHYLVDPDEWQVAMGPGGALEALLEAREQGLTRFIGVTGHDLSIASMHLRSLERFDFDSVLLPYNSVVMSSQRYAADFEALMEVCRERDVAVQTIKAVARGPWNGRPQNYSTWYQPLDDQGEIDLAVQWVLRRPGIFLNTVGEPKILPMVLDAAARFSADALPADLDRQVAELQLQPLFS